MTKLLEPDDFRDLAGPLVLEPGADGAPVELRVAAVTPLAPHRLRAQPFSLQLHGPGAQVLPQSMYAVRHPRLGVLELFLVPIAADGKRATYEVVFN
jgi:hypothetical protein